RVAIAELEDVAYLDSRVDAQRLSAVRATLPCRHRPQIRICRWHEILPRSQILEVVILFIGACDEICSALQRFVHQQDRLAVIFFQIATPLDSDGPEISPRGIEQRFAL